MENDITPEDELKAENELLKLKLEMEHGMPASETSNLSPELENEWLSHIYEFENAYKNAEQIKLHDFIGKPSFPKAETLSEKELSTELDRLDKILEENGINVDFICEYSEQTAYKFITEELFEHEMDNMRVKGMTTNFIYEEFHPNHDYDLRKDSISFVENLLKRKWDEKFNSYVLVNPVSFHEKEYNRHDISEIIITFQEAHKSFEVEQLHVTESAFDLASGNGRVSLHILYKAQLQDGNWKHHSGDALVQFKYDGDYWSIAEFSLPGF